MIALQGFEAHVVDRSESCSTSFSLTSIYFQLDEGFGCKRQRIPRFHWHCVLGILGFAGNGPSWDFNW